MSAPKVPQRVILLYRGVRPGVELLALLGDDRAVSVIKAPPELSGVDRRPMWSLSTFPLRTGVRSVNRSAITTTVR